jgi:hypothetical protein
MSGQTIDLEQFIESGGNSTVMHQNADLSDKDAPPELIEDAATKQPVDEAEDVAGEGGEETEAEETPEATTKDSIDEALDALASGVEKPVWDDKAKELFKKTFGAEDPDAFLSEYNTLKESASQATQKVGDAEKFLDRIGKMPYELAQALKAAGEGKDYKPFLKELASGLTLSKPAKELDKLALVGKHYPNKFSQEQLDEIKNGDADDDLKERFDAYLGLAAEKHDSARAKEMATIEATKEQQRIAQEADKRSATEALAHAKSDPIVSKLMNELPPGTTDEYMTGVLEEKLLYNEDGTRRKDALALLVKGMMFDKALTRAVKGAQAKARTEARTEQHAKTPSVPNPANGRRPAPKANAKDGPKLAPELAAFWDN